MPEFAAYQSRVLENTQVLAASLIEAGFDLVTEGSDTHLVLVDLRSKNITGLRRNSCWKDRNHGKQNSIPFDRRSRG